jgi:O-acetyl-ADP-ribose deacetylase (regulator of RNase III)
VIEEVQGNLLRADAEAIVNTVNCVGVMGKGVALQFKQAFPEMARTYEEACKRGEVQPGRMLVWSTGELQNPRYVINFPTKRHWIGKSSYKDIEAGLAALVVEVERLGIKSIALPPLGCGNGGLNWAKVRPMIVEAFETIPEVLVLLFSPAGAPPTESRVIKTKKPDLTRPRALFLLAMDRYSVLAYETSQLEIQKLAYFLQEAGERLRLRFSAQRYGPYAENLNKVLETLEGHYISGFDGERSPDKALTLKPGAVEEARARLSDDDEARSRLSRVSDLIEGFETPYGMELLSSVHFVAWHAEPRARSSTEAVTAVHDWSDRKMTLMQPEHITLAWDRLGSLQWID